MNSGKFKPYNMLFTWKYTAGILLVKISIDKKFFFKICDFKIKFRIFFHVILFGISNQVQQVDEIFIFMNLICWMKELIFSDTIYFFFIKKFWEILQSKIIVLKWSKIIENVQRQLIFMQLWMKFFSRNLSDKCDEWKSSNLKWKFWKCGNVENVDVQNIKNIENSNIFNICNTFNLQILNIFTIFTIVNIFNIFKYWKCRNAEKVDNCDNAENIKNVETDDVENTYKHILSK